MILEKTRKPLKRGNKYYYWGHSYNHIKIRFVVFRGHEEDDGGAEGVAVEWYRSGKRTKGGFYICSNDRQFFEMDIFANAFDRPAGELT